MPGRKTQLPSTLKKSDTRAQHIYVKAHDSAVETYGEGERAHRVAYAALKHSYRKKGDRWVPKQERGPSDPQAARGPTTPRKSTDEPRARTSQGEEAPIERWRKEDLYNLAQDLRIPGRSSMTKDELIKAIRKR